MRDWDVKVRFVRQPTSSTCVHACLAMVTGIPVDDLIERFGNHGLSNEEEATVLTENGILPVPVHGMGDTHPMIYFGVYFLTVPSLNIPGANHRIVSAISEDGKRWTSYDPNVGRKGKSYYPRNAFYSNRRPFSYSEVTFLDPLRLHKGTQDRIARFK